MCINNVTTIGFISTNPTIIWALIKTKKLITQKNLIYEEKVEKIGKKKVMYRKII